MGRVSDVEGALGIEADANQCSLCPLSMTSLFGSSANITDNEGTGCILPWLDTGRSFTTEL
ncbi:hypothetical protein CY34DRAFT_220533 [Suillus luteus UH-Slu-Lm8-n1]|uniref:Uncharacterized protein n=1 Tax=Suillus luteus UH-Slu-Lm8-n1 TaxID=930992 RepID=A0A0D0AHA2_9AGAM|nr:hypothetical protein CY34DRAFT_220533 [Suillus luteus UH-Slu-Lm8-n1]